MAPNYWTNESHRLFAGGDEPTTVQASAAVTGKRFVAISAAPASGPALNTSGDGANFKVAHATAAGPVFGVARYDIASGDKGQVLHQGDVVEVTSSAAVAVGAEVEVATGGKSVTLSSGKSVGIAVTAASGADVDHYVLIK